MSLSQVKTKPRLVSPGGTSEKDPFAVRKSKIVNTHTEWDPLEEILSARRPLRSCRLWAPEMVEASYSSVTPLSSKWLGMNVLMISEQLAVVDLHQTELIKMLEGAGVSVLPLRLRHGRQLGGGSIATRRIERSADIVAAFEDAFYEVMHTVPKEIRAAVIPSFTNGRANFLIEEYLAPAERLKAHGLGRVTVELLVEDGTIRFFAMADGRCVSDTDHRNSELCFPSRLGAEDEHQFRDLAEKVVSLFGLNNGPVILDAVMTDTGPQLYEINARIDTALVLPLITSCWGVDLIEETLKIAAGIPLSTELERDPEGSACAHLVLAPQLSRITCLELSHPADANRNGKVTVLKKEGDTVAGPEGGYDCIAVIEGHGADRDDVYAQIEQRLSELKLDLLPVSNPTEAPAA